MSNEELEQAAMAPYRWIKLCTATFAKNQSNGSRTELQPTIARIIQEPFDEARIGIKTFLVPGGRYLVAYLLRRIGIWDLGYTPNADPKLIASAKSDKEFYTCMINATSDGMGLIIVAFSRKNCYVYEIYPQSPIPQLTQIAHLDLNSARHPLVDLLPNRVVLYDHYKDRIIFTVWDYRLNHSTCFSADLADEEYDCKAIATKTAVIVLCKEAILLWAIPPLSPQPLDFFDDNPTCIPSLFRVIFPDSLIQKTELVKWEVMSSWYSGSSQPIYFDALHDDFKLYGFEIVIEPDLSNVFFYARNSSQLSRGDCNLLCRKCSRNSICEDTLVSITYPTSNQCTTYIRPKSPPPANVISPGGPKALYTALLSVIGSPQIHSLCPASGKFAYSDIDRIIVVDFLHTISDT